MGKPFSSWTYDDATDAVGPKFALLNVCPDLAALDFGDYGIVDSVFSGQLGLISMSSALKSLFYFPYLLVCKFRDSVVFTARRETDLKSVFAVSGKGYVFQVGIPIVCFYPVYVVYVMAFGFWAKKRTANKTLYGICPLLLGKTKRDIQIAVCASVWAENVTSLCSAGGFISSDPSEIGNRVKTGKVANNRTPLFFLKFFSAKFVGRHGMNLLHRFVSSLSWGDGYSSSRLTYIVP